MYGKVVTLPKKKIIKTSKPIVDSIDYRINNVSQAPYVCHCVITLCGTYSMDLQIPGKGKVHRSYKEGIAKLCVVFRLAGQHLRNGTKQ
jgi:hypothetical protein